MSDDTTGRDLVPRPEDPAGAVTPREPDVPTSSAISEYLDVTHAFFERGDAKFANGVLDAVAKAVR